MDGTLDSGSQDSKRVFNEDIDRVRLAALLHDVGHGPFSHVSEHLLKKYAPADADTGQVLEKIHEKITVDISGAIRKLKTF